MIFIFQSSEYRLARFGLIHGVSVICREVSTRPFRILRA
jgi:hypothetical protein